MATYDRVRDLPLEIESYRLEPLEVQASHDFTRLTTVIHLEGGGHEGVGEDVTYSSEDQVALQAEGPTLPLAGSHTLDSFSQLLEGLALFPSGPGDGGLPGLPPLGLRERGARPRAAPGRASRSPEAVGREAQPVTFVVSLRIEQPPRPDPVPLLLERYPSLRFKLDPTSEWDAELVDDPAAHGRGGHGRPEGRLQGHASSTSRATRSSTGWSPRASRRRGSRIPT